MEATILTVTFRSDSGQLRTGELINPATVVDRHAFIDGDDVQVLTWERRGIALNTVPVENIRAIHPLTVS